MQVRMHEPSDHASIKQGIGQGDTISSKLFTLQEDIMKALNWNEIGVNCTGSRMSHLRFADDLILIAGNSIDLQTMIQDLHEASLTIDLEMSKSKTKIMYNRSQAPIS